MCVFYENEPTHDVDGLNLELIKSLNRHWRVILGQISLKVCCCIWINVLTAHFFASSFWLPFTIFDWAFLKLKWIVKSTHVFVTGAKVNRNLIFQWTLSKFIQLLIYSWHPLKHHRWASEHWPALVTHYKNNHEQLEASPLLNSQTIRWY